jgi:hypothetical protein
LADADCHDCDPCTEDKCILAKCVHLVGACDGK